MRRGLISKAISLSGHEPIEDVEIVIGGAGGIFPDHFSPAEASHRFNEEAGIILRHLVSALPGGTLDRLLIRLLEHKASQLRVPILPLIGKRSHRKACKDPDCAGCL
jgi:hypothetical protein